MRILEIVLSLLTTINNCRYHRLAKSKKGYIVASSPIYYSSPVFRYPVTYSTPTYVSPIVRTSPVVSSVVYPSPVISSSVVYSTPVYSTAYYRRLKKIKKDLQKKEIDEEQDAFEKKKKNAQRLIKNLLPDKNE